MSGSETGEMNSREPFLQSSSGLHNLNTDYSSGTNAIYKPFPAAATSPPPFQSAAGAGGPVAAAPAGGDVSVGAGGGVMSQPAGPNMNMGGGGGGGAEPVKRKRGRPRKYGPDGTMSMALSPSAARPTAAPVSQSSGAFSPPPAPASRGATASAISAKKTRGRPPGSTKKQQVEALGSGGFALTPHVITVKAGEDVSSKIMSFSQNGPRAICILSANGTISNVTLQQPTTSGGTVTYEGRFDIVSLSGSFTLSENDGHRSRAGGLSVALSSSDGRVIGGCVAGLLIAASPVQVIVASFAVEGHKEFTGPRGLAAAGIPNGVSSPPSHGTLSESSGGQGSPLNQSTGAGNNPHGMSSMSWK